MYNEDDVSPKNPAELTNLLEVRVVAESGDQQKSEDSGQESGSISQTKRVKR